MVRNYEVDIVEESLDSEIDCPQKKAGRFQFSETDSEEELEGSNKADQYSIDVNENRGKIIMKLRKQTNS